MQIDSELIGIVSAVGTSIITSSIGYGVMRQKVTRMERDIEIHIADDKEVHKEFVHKVLFDTVVLQVKADLDELKISMKELLARIHGQA